MLSIAEDTARLNFFHTTRHALRLTGPLADNPIAEILHACWWRADLDMVNRSGQRLLGLIVDVLDMAKIEAGRIIVENAPFALHKLVRNKMDMMRLRAHAKNLELILTCLPPCPASPALTPRSCAAC